MNRLILAVLALACISLPAQACPRHSVAQCVETGTVLHPVCGMGTRVETAHVSQREQKRLARGQELYDGYAVRDSLTSRGRCGGFHSWTLICARNVNAEQAARGYCGTGSAAARSFRTWGRRNSGQVDDVAMFG